MYKYLVKIYWLKRGLERYGVDADNESQAVMRAVSLGKKSKNELYDHIKSSAKLVHRNEIKI